MAEALIEIKLDEAKLRNVQRLLQDIPRALPRAMSRAVNKTVAPVRTYMARQLVGPINAELTAVESVQKAVGRKIPKKISPKTGKGRHFKFKISTIKSNIRFQKATYRIWQALIWIKRFKGQESHTTTEPAFIAEMPKSGHISIFRRLGATRLPIADQLRRLMVEYFKGITGPVKQEAQARLERNVEDQVKLALSEWKAGAQKAA